MTGGAAYYHGCRSALDHLTFRPGGGMSDDPSMMFFSASVNVAQRYGPDLFVLEMDTGALPVISLEDWLTNRPVPSDSFIIAGEPDSYDFPAPTLVLRSEPGAPILRIASNAVAQLDDGLALKHEPDSPQDRQFKEWAEDFYGSVEEALKKIA